MRPLFLAGILLGLLLIFPVAGTTRATSIGRYQEFGDAAGFLNILPPGSDGVLNGAEAIAVQTGQYPPHVKDQLPMYSDLVYHTPGLAEEDLSRFFKDASFGVPEDDIDRVYTPIADVTVVRDRSYGVPHIFGQTRYATMFAMGYTGAEDRLFLMDVLRHVGRARVSEFLGASPANLALDRDQITVAPYREADFTKQLQDSLAAGGEEAQLLYADLLAYVDGVNKYINEAILDPWKLPAEYPALQQAPLPWKPEDTVAVASLVGGIFGRGGGGELANHCGLKSMAATLPGGAAEARAIFDDLHFANDPEAPTSSRDAFTYMTDLGPADPAAHPDIDCATLQPIDDYATSLDDLLRAAAGQLTTATVDAPWGPMTLDFNSGMSNAVLVGGKHTRTKRPIAVFGPQTGYFMPQLLVEKDVHGPGIDARGVAFAGTDLYVQLGRGRNYAWSATSSGADNVDQFVLRLCDPAGGPATIDSMGYLRRDICEPIETFQHTQIAKPTAGGVPEGPDIVLSWRVDRSKHYGPLVARGTLSDGTPIAVATLRSTYFTELGSAPAFYRMNNPDYVTNGFNSFREAMSAVQYTFNWFYIDANNIGYQHSCRCPQRAQGVDPYLPPWGTGGWDWLGFIPHEREPWDLNPSEGWITSWNNKQAPGFMANDRNFGYGPTYRSQLLDARLLTAISQGKLDRADVVRVMEEAGTTDLRGQELLPLLLQALGASPPPGMDPRLADMRARLSAWTAAGSHHRDLDRSGEYDDAVAPAIIEFWWPELSHAMFDAASANAITALGMEIDDHNRVGHIGSAFQGGTFSHVNKDLRQLLGKPVAGRWSRTYCGAGNPAVCRQSLWESMARAAQALEAKYASPNVADWKWAIAEEDIRHSAAGVTSVPAIHWVNRPTFQQVVQVGVDVPVSRGFGAGALTGAGGKKIGFAFDVQELIGGGAEGRFLLHDFKTKKTVDMQEISNAGSPAGDGCGSISSGAPGSFEFTGTGRFNGSGSHTVHVCIQDNADPGDGADRLHVECATCPYNTTTAAASEALTFGNIDVAGADEAPPPPGTPQVVVLGPVLGAIGSLGAPLTLTATAYDAEGNPVPGMALSFLAGAPLNLTPLAAITDSEGQLIFTAAALLPVDTEIRAVAAGTHSNPVQLSWK